MGQNPIRLWPLKVFFKFTRKRSFRHVASTCLPLTPCVKGGAAWSSPTMQGVQKQDKSYFPLVIMNSVVFRSNSDQL